MNKCAHYSDEELFRPNHLVCWDDDEVAQLKGERQKRRDAKEAEEARINQERVARINARKNAITYSESLASKICQGIASGAILTVICLDKDMPTVARCNEWRTEHDDFQAAYNDALKRRLDIFEEQTLEFSRDESKDFIKITKKGKTEEIPNPLALQRDKLRIEVCFRHLKSGRPQKWGDVSTLITKSDDGFDPSNFSAEELEAKIAAIEQKSRTVRDAA